MGWICDLDNYGFISSGPLTNGASYYQALKGVGYFGRFSVFKSYDARFKKVPLWLWEVLVLKLPVLPFHSGGEQRIYFSKIPARVVR